MFFKCEYVKGLLKEGCEGRTLFLNEDFHVEIDIKIWVYHFGSIFDEYIKVTTIDRDEIDIDLFW